MRRRIESSQTGKSRRLGSGNRGAFIGEREMQPNLASEMVQRHGIAGQILGAGGDRQHGALPIGDKANAGAMAFQRDDLRRRIGADGAAIEPHRQRRCRQQPGGMRRHQASDGCQRIRERQMRGRIDGKAGHGLQPRILRHVQRWRAQQHHAGYMRERAGRCV